MDQSELKASLKGHGGNKGGEPALAGSFFLGWCVEDDVVDVGVRAAGGVEVEFDLNKLVARDVVLQVPAVIWKPCVHRTRGPLKTHPEHERGISYQATRKGPSRLRRHGEGADRQALIASYQNTAAAAASPAANHSKTGTRT